MDLGYISPNTSKTFNRQNFNYQNKKAFENSLYSADWSSIDELANTEGPNTAYKAFFSQYKQLYDSAFPIEICKCSRSLKGPKQPWMSSALLKSCKRKSTL